MKFVILLLYPFLIFAIDVFNAETALILLQDSDKEVYYEEKKIPIIEKNSKRFVLIPVDYREKSSRKRVVIVSKGNKREIFLHVRKKRYKREILKVNSEKVTPPKDVLDRIYKEYKEAKKIYSAITPKIYWRGDFQMPLKSKVTSSFGSARIFNGTLKSFHSGIDFRAKVSTPVNAVNNGVVVIAKERYYAGGSVVIDHGGGLYSCYYHLSKIFPKVGDRVQKGQLIGLSGKSGRVTGPHLHFGMILYGKSVNPKALIELLNEI